MNYKSKSDTARAIGSVPFHRTYTFHVDEIDYHVSIVEEDSKRILVYQLPRDIARRSTPDNYRSQTKKLMAYLSAAWRSILFEFFKSSKGRFLPNRV